MGIKKEEGGGVLDGWVEHISSILESQISQGARVSGIKDMKKEHEKNSRSRGSLEDSAGAGMPAH